MKSLKWILIIAIIIVGMAIFFVKPNAPQQVVNNQLENIVVNQLSENQETGLTPANADVDDFIAALLIDSQNEQLSFDDEESDLSLVNLDDQAINNLSQSYDENEF